MRGLLIAALFFCLAKGADTGDHDRGSFLFVLVNGRPRTELQIDRRVSEGTIYLHSGLTETDIKLMNKDWKLLGRRK